MDILTIILFIASIAFITKGADWFIESAVSISEKSGIPKVIIGATIVSFATTAPELAVSATAAYLNHPEVATGNAVGSALCNTGFVLGSVILIKSINLDIGTFIRKGAIMLISGIILLITTIDGTLSRFDGFVLLLIFIGFLYYNYRLQYSIFRDTGTKMNKETFTGLKSDIFFFVIGSSSVIIGSRLLIDTGVKIAQWIGIPEIIIGLTLIALGTSLPEFITAVSSCIKGHQDLSIGNILGANTMDIALVLGISSQIRNLPILEQSINYDFPVMLLIMSMLIIFGLTNKRLDRWEGAVIFGTYAVYITGLFVWFN